MRKPAARKPAARKPAKRKRAPHELPVEYMLRVMRDPKADETRRDTMAKSATPYVHTKPATKKKSARGGEAGLKRRLETARETLACKIAGLRTEGS